MGLWGHAPSPLPTRAARTPLHEHVLDGATRQRGQRGLDGRTKAVHEATARALDILSASNMWSTASREVSEPRAFTHKSLAHTRRLARGQHDTSPIARRRYCLGACARAALRTSALSECCATAVAPQNKGAAARSRSRRLSRSRPIGKLRPDRGRAATQIRCEQLVQDSPARPTRYGLEAQKPRRWVIIIYRGKRAVGSPFHPHVQHVFVRRASAI